eukprot:1434869-Amphidinium_carterae.1
METCTNLKVTLHQLAQGLFPKLTPRRTQLQDFVHLDFAVIAWDLLVKWCVCVCARALMPLSVKQQCGWLPKSPELPH